MCLGASIPSRILIVDDHEIVRQGLRRILEMRGDWEICGEASNGKEALRLANELLPDAIIMDITMPVMGGLEAAAEIMKGRPDSKVLIFTMHEPAVVRRQALQSGARGVLAKSRVASELEPALLAILAGQTYFH